MWTRFNIAAERGMLLDYFSCGTLEFGLNGIFFGIK
jgi:hypothetical protein